MVTSNMQFLRVRPGKVIVFRGRFKPLGSSANATWDSTAIFSGVHNGTCRRPNCEVVGGPSSVFFVGE